ncbi:MAG: hypothetical protein KIT84_21585 [Labilithrix sp.]|nr:hypothetical protein [Labilithrix sp.]MCW5813637.1 hypothetical protein [Labilithrix sp.]
MRTIHRRDVLKRTFWLITAGVVAPHLLTTTGCASESESDDEMPSSTDDLSANDCFINDLLRGALPEDAVSAVSSRGRFHHYHFLSVPAEVLAKPPEQGWSTLSSMMIETLGIDDYFFRNAEVNRQFHCHRVSFTRAELRAIAAGAKTTITAYIRSNGQPSPNHTFTFNDTETMEQKSTAIIAVARRAGLRTQRSVCSAANRRSVTVFRGDRAEETIRSAARLERLIQGES